MEVFVDVTLKSEVVERTDEFGARNPVTNFNIHEEGQKFDG